MTDHIFDKPDLDDVLAHYGVKGMKWGVRRTDAQLGNARSGFKKPQLTDKQKTALKVGVGIAAVVGVGVAYKTLGKDGAKLVSSLPSTKTLQSGESFLHGRMMGSLKDTNSSYVTRQMAEYGLKGALRDLPSSNREAFIANRVRQAMGPESTRLQRDMAEFGLRNAIREMKR